MRKITFNENKNIIYMQLRRIRKEKGLSQQEMAARLQIMGINIDQQMISKIEHNQRMVTDYELACLCKILNVDPKDLLDNGQTN